MGEKTMKTTRTVIQEMICTSKNKCNQGAPTPEPLDYVSRNEMTTGCQSCPFHGWMTVKIIP
jgi:hypothetical protein